MHVTMATFLMETAPGLVGMMESGALVPLLVTVRSLPCDCLHVFMSSSVAPSITATVISSGPPIAGQSYSLTCTVCIFIAESLTPTITYEWTKGGTLVSGNDHMLTFNILTISSSGQYVCTVTVTSSLLTTTLTNESETFQVMIKGKPLYNIYVHCPHLSLVLPPSVSLSPPPTGVFSGQSVVLTCTIVLDSSVDTPVIVAVQWFNPASTIIDSTMATMQFALIYESTTTIRVFNARNSSTYMCAAIVIPTIPLTTSSDNVSASTNVSLSKFLPFTI